MKKQAFSLVELSIVLVILGLLTGGILAGQSLIRAAELRSVATDSQRYIAALNAFRDKYFAIPGDMTNATGFWGKDTTSSAACSGQAGTAATPGTCNGNGDGVIAVVGSSGINNESYRAWQHLANAGLIEGSYAGTISASTTASVPGTDIPKSKISNGGWSFVYLSQLSTSSFEVGYSDLPDIRNNYLFLGATQSAYWADNIILKPEEAWNIDTKLDDGKPAFGKVRGGHASANTCTTDTTSASSYALNTTSATCALGFMIN